MERATKIYIYSVIGAGALLLASSLTSWSPAADLWLWALYVALAVVASVVKLRLPGMEGTYSLSFLFLLYGVAHFSLPQTLMAGCAGVVAQSVLNTKKRPSLIQVLFNAGNVIISVGACFAVARAVLAAGMAHYPSAVLAAVACAYFLVNTVLVSGVLSLLQSKPLKEVCSQWYLWYLPYYLIGVTLVGLVPAPGQAVSGEAGLVLLPLAYLVHFFVGLAKWHASPVIGNTANAPLPASARNYLIGVVSAGVCLLTVAALTWQSQNPVCFLIYMALAMAASTLKIRLPYLSGTVTPAFVLLLAAIVQLSFAETAVMAAMLGAVQVLWLSLIHI